MALQGIVFCCIFRQFYHYEIFLFVTKRIVVMGGLHMLSIMLIIVCVNVFMLLFNVFNEKSGALWMR